MTETLDPTQRRSRYPFTSTPDGWYQVAKSSELAVGEVRPIRYFGQDLVMLRSESGEVRVHEAHCPHLGAHLGHGGRVEGEELVCPFHAWRFDREGRCSAIPYQRRGTRPEVGLRSKRVDERSGLILVWHSDDDSPPEWWMRDIPEFEAPDWLGYETRRWRIRMHVQELAENVPDTAHFEVIHGLPVLPRAEPKVEGPVYYQRSSVPGASMGTTDEDYVFAEQEAWGLGLVWLRVPQKPGVFFVTATTPIDDEYCELTQHLLIEDIEGRGEISPEQHEMIEGVFSQTDNDVPIWENKVYRDKPPLIEDDGPLPILRRWARQFYPELRD
jgi:phenylpropionate dioxygenase-like ring-hydroxylating dioxygenase large terminal subunit